MQTEQDLVELQDSTEEPVVAVSLPVTSWYDTLSEMYFAEFETERHLDRIKYVIDTIENRLLDLDLPLSREEYTQRTNPENERYKTLNLNIDSEPQLFTTAENN